MKNIIFDLGGVLLNLDVPKTSEAFKALGLTQIDELFRIGFATSYFMDYEKGTISDELFIEKAQQQSAPGTTREQIIAAWNDMLLDFPAERVAFLKKLQGKYRIYLFSNTNQLHLLHFHRTYREAYGSNMDDLFIKAYYSHLIKLRKPDVAAFEYVIKDSGVQAAETLFIDDALINVEGAIKAGLQGLHLTGGKTILDLGL